MKKLFIRTSVIAGIIIILILLVCFVRIPYYVHSRGIVMPVKEWVLKKDAKGTFISVFKNNLTNSATQYTVTQFQRGDLAQFQLKENLFDSDRVFLGDTIGLISSTEEEKRYVELMAELQVQRSLLKVYTSGEKPEKIRMAYESMVKAEQEYNTQKQLTERQEVLFDKEYISVEEYELSYNELLVKKQDVNVAKANYEALITGAKQEEIDYINASIHALEMQIEQAEKRLSSYYVTSPIDGRIVGQHTIIDNEDIFLTVADCSQLLVVLPVEIYKLPYVDNDHELVLTANTIGSTYNARIASIDNSVQMLGQRQNVFITAIFNHDSSDLLSGMIMDATIDAGLVTIPEYIRRLFRVVKSN
ncbi:MAG TPA: hypothetical protein PK908_03090 [Bacteroidales bacterium]|nr:hypothetical protein [Bacteroidales bacterium]